MRMKQPAKQLRFDVTHWRDVSQRWDLLGDEAAYRCVTCRDEGRVTVFSRVTLEQALAAAEGRREPEDITVRTVAVPCSCRRGDALARSRFKREVAAAKKSGLPETHIEPPVQFGDSRIVPVRLIDDHAGRLQQALRWALDAIGRRAEQRAEIEAPYQAFAEWNDG